MGIEEKAAEVGIEIAKDVYKDGLSGATKEAGSTLTNIAKTVNLLFIPFQLTALAKDRVTKYIKEVYERVPEEKQTLVSESYAGEIINYMSYVGENDYLKDYYINLLENAVNQDKVQFAHPAFPTIIHQLSQDEILILERLKEGDIVTSLKNEQLDSSQNDIVVESNYDLKLLSFPNLRGVYMEHLQKQYILRIYSVGNRRHNVNGDNMYHRTMGYKLTEFGKIFLQACSR